MSLSTAVEVAARYGVSRQTLYLYLKGSPKPIPSPKEVSKRALERYTCAALDTCAKELPPLPEVGQMLFDSVRRLRELGDLADDNRLDLKILAESKASQVLVAIAKLVVSVRVAREPSEAESLAKLPADELMRRARETIEAHGVTVEKENENDEAASSEAGDRDHEVRGD